MGVGGKNGGRELLSFSARISGCTISVTYITSHCYGALSSYVCMYVQYITNVRTHGVRNTTYKYNTCIYVCRPMHICRVTEANQ